MSGDGDEVHESCLSRPAGGGRQVAEADGDRTRRRPFDLPPILKVAAFSGGIAAFRSSGRAATCASVFVVFFGWDTATACASRRNLVVRKASVIA